MQKKKALLVSAMVVGLFPMLATFADGTSSQKGAIRFSKIRQEISDQDDAKAAADIKRGQQLIAESLKNIKKEREADDKAFPQKVKNGTGMRFDFGDGISLDLVKVDNHDKPFFIGRFEITQEQYEMVMGNNPSRYAKSDRAKHPVENVTWFDAIEFCRIINHAFAKELGNYVFSLPTVQQWTQAAEAGSKAKFPGGNILDEVAWNRGNSGMRTHDVGTRKANALGLYDLSGNVFEWSIDKTLSEGWRKRGGGSYRVGIYEDGGNCTIEKAFDSEPEYRQCEDLGFRVVAVSKKSNHFALQKEAESKLQDLLLKKKAEAKRLRRQAKLEKETKQLESEAEMAAAQKATGAMAEATELKGLLESKEETLDERRLNQRLKLMEELARRKHHGSQSED